MRDWKAVCEQLCKELKVAKGTIEQLQWRLRETEDALEEEQQGRRKELKEAILDLLR